MVASPGGVWPTACHMVNVAWIVIFVTLALGHYRTARVLTALAIVPGLVALLQAQLTGIMPAPFGPWAWWVLFNLALVVAMAAFHRDAPPPPAPRQPPPPRHIRARWPPRRTQDMPFPRPPRTLPALASALAAAGVVLAVASCSSIAPPPGAVEVRRRSGRGG
ncbi:MAG TPA: hypothetical protein VGS62_07320 [Streptosporangiaceae bacterium]|nr:hypothetical protein [Streptosporangiaceae bacterium]